MMVKLLKSLCFLEFFCKYKENAAFFTSPHVKKPQIAKIFRFSREFVSICEPCRTKAEVERMVRVIDCECRS